MHEMLVTTFAGQSGRDHVLQQAEALAQMPLGRLGRGQAAMSGATARNLAIGWLSAALCGPVLASDLRQPAAPPGPVLASAPSFSVTSYIWATAIDGRSATLPPLPPADINLRFRDVLKELNGAMMASAEMRIERWSVLVDGQFSQVTTGGNLPGPFFSALKLRSQTTTLQGSVFYRVYEDTVLALDVGAGVRFWNLDTKLEILPGLANLRIDHRQSQMWADPILGARLGVKLDGPWSLTVAGDIGGFSAGSRLTWQALGSVNYAWSENLTLKAGYRALHVDYRSGSFSYDVTQHGPVVAATYRF
jgi:opacity protein-like surface antigen